MQKKESNISVIVIAHNEEAHIKRCLSSLFYQTKKADEIIVVVHNSTDKTAEIVAGFFPLVRLVQFEGPAGTIYARMKGFEMARYEWIACIDGDSYTDNVWVDEITKPLADRSIAAVTNPTLFDGNLFVWFGTRFYFYAVHGSMNLFLRTFFSKVRELTFWGTSFACRKSDFEKVGGFQGMIPIKSLLSSEEWHEDFYLSLRLRKLGRIFITKKTVVHSSGKQKTSWDSIRRFALQQINEKRIVAAVSRMYME